MQLRGVGSVLGAGAGSALGAGAGAAKPSFSASLRAAGCTRAGKAPMARCSTLLSKGLSSDLRLFRMGPGATVLMPFQAVLAAALATLPIFLMSLPKKFSNSGSWGAAGA